MESTRVELEKLTSMPKFKNHEAQKERRRRQERELAGSRSFTGRARAADCSVLNDAGIIARQNLNNHTMINTSVNSGSVGTFQKGRFSEYLKLEQDEDANNEEGTAAASQSQRQ